MGRYFGGRYGKMLLPSATNANTQAVLSMRDHYYRVASSQGDNYFGNGSDGNISTSGNVDLTVLNKNGSYDGDMVVREYGDFVINAGHTVTTDQPCRGLMIFVNGNATISGTLSMKGRGALGNPSSTGASDGNSVGSAGLQIPVRNSGGSDLLSANEVLFNGYGDAARTAGGKMANIVPGSLSGTTYSIVRTGGADTAAYGGHVHNGVTGNTITNGTGGGGQGSNGYAGGNGHGQGIGRAGTCFGGGSGGGGGNNARDADTVATAYGGQGGPGVSRHTARCTGGAGNPNGPESTTNGYSGSTNVSNGESGTGGIIIMFVQGALVINSGGKITADGCRSDSIDGNGYNWLSTGGGSGGGAIRIFHKGALTNNGSVTVAGGVAGTWSDGGNGAYCCNGGNGGAGSAVIAACI